MIEVLTIRAGVNESLDSEGARFPESVTVIGAGFLAPSAVTDIAQKALDTLSYGPTNQPYLAELPNSEDVADNMVLKVMKR